MDMMKMALTNLDMIKKDTTEKDLTLEEFIKLQKLF